MAFLTQPLPAELLDLLVEGEWALAAPPRADAGNDSEPVRHRFEAEGVDVWLTRDTGVAAPPLEAVALNLERREATVERSNVGGYHSHTDLFDAFPRATHAARRATETAARALGANTTAQAPATRVAVEGARLVVDGNGDYQLAVRAGAANLELAGAARANDADSGSVEAWVNVSRAGHFNVLHCVEIKFTARLYRRIDPHAIDATPARWRGDVASSPLDGASAATPSPRNDLVEKYRCTRHTG